MTFFDHKNLGNHLLQLCPKVVKHPVYHNEMSHVQISSIFLTPTASTKCSCTQIIPTTHFPPLTPTVILLVASASPCRKVYVPKFCIRSLSLVPPTHPAHCGHQYLTDLITQGNLCTPLRYMNTMHAFPPPLFLRPTVFFSADFQHRAIYIRNS